MLVDSSAGFEGGIWEGGNRSLPSASSSTVHKTEQPKKKECRASGIRHIACGKHSLPFRVAPIPRLVRMLFGLNCVIVLKVLVVNRLVVGVELSWEHVVAAIQRDPAAVE